MDAVLLLGLYEITTNEILLKQNIYKYLNLKYEISQVPFSVETTASFVHPGKAFWTHSFTFHGKMSDKEVQSNTIRWSTKHFDRERWKEGNLPFKDESLTDSLVICETLNQTEL